MASFFILLPLAHPFSPHVTTLNNPQLLVSQSTQMLISTSNCLLCTTAELLSLTFLLTTRLILILHLSSDSSALHHQPVDKSLSMVPSHLLWASQVLPLCKVVSCHLR